MKKILASFAALAGSLAAGVTIAEMASAAPLSCTSSTTTDVTNPSVTGLTSTGTLVCFRAGAPEKQKVLGTVSGLATDTSLVGIDFRPADGLLYGVGNAGGLYTIDTTTAVATKFAQISVALDGTKFGVDFNPAANALRIVSDTGQNLRITALSPAGMTGTTNVDGALNNGAVPPVPTTGTVGAAYTNNDALTQTGTTLFDLSAANTIGIQSSANSGVVVPTGDFTAIADATDGDLDIRTNLSGKNIGYALIVTPTGSRFTSVDLLDAQLPVTMESALSVVDIALPIQ
jgi:Domain of unknown function (DUF4394)